MVRVMTPLAKMFTGKQVVEVLSEILEAFGGMGYIEGSMLPSLYRDAQVLPIWEGTTNVMCYDVVRALSKKENKFWPLQSLQEYLQQSFEQIKNEKSKKAA